MTNYIFKSPLSAVGEERVVQRSVDRLPAAGRVESNRLLSLALSKYPQEIKNIFQNNLFLQIIYYICNI